MFFGHETLAEPAGSAVDGKTLHAKIGELTIENDAPKSHGALLRYPVRSARRGTKPPHLIHEDE